MEKKHWSILGMGLVAALWLALSVITWCRPPQEYSAAERRPLEQFPQLREETVLSGEFMSDFESYTLDQFPMRDLFRGIKARVQYSVMGRLDNNGVYRVEEQWSKLDYPLDREALAHALKIFEGLRQKELADSKIFTAVIPDKNYFLAQRLGYPVMDYDALVETVREGMPYASYVNLFGTLEAGDYYTTDTHWRQERLGDTAARLCAALGIPEPEHTEAVDSGVPFYGVYYGQAAVSPPPDTLYTLKSPVIDACRVYNYENGKWGGIYDWEKLSGEDGYEVFLSGPVSLLRIENPLAETDRELILFRDSFGSSLAPLLVQGYKTVTLVDIRYLSSGMLGRFLDFHGQDVLFCYSTLVLNNGKSLH